MLDTLNVTTVRDDRKEEVKDVLKRYEDTVEYYSGDKDSRVTAKKKKKKGSTESESEAKKPEGKLKAIEDEARKLQEETDTLLKASEEKIKESHLVHAKGNRFDLGELGLQFGVVLCSLAILTKARGLWFVGIASSLVGAAVAASGQFGLFLGHH
jgi:hypothetical protein